MTKSTFTILLLELIASTSFAVDIPWSLRWTGGPKSQKQNVPAYFSQQKGLIVMAAKAPTGGPAKLVEAFLVSNGARTKIFARDIKGSLFLYLQNARGQVEFKTADNHTLNYTYNLEKHPAELRLSPTCTAHGLDVSVLSKGSTTFPAFLDCRYGGQVLTTLVFSSMQDSSWYGAGVFEAAGKGERYKEFNGKDVSNLKNLDISWGAADQKNTARVKLFPLLAPQSASNFQFRAGLLYETGTFQKLGTSTPLAGILIPLEIQYHHENYWWLVGGGYRLFVYSTAGTGSSSNSSTELDVWAGGILDKKSFQGILRLGYSTLNLDIPTLGTSSTLAAPEVILEFTFGREKSFGLDGRYAQTDSTGTYSKTDFGIYYQRPLIAKLMTRLELDSTQLSASTNGVDIKANWISAALTIQL